MPESSEGGSTSLARCEADAVTGPPSLRQRVGCRLRLQRLCIDDQTLVQCMLHSALTTTGELV